MAKQTIAVVGAEERMSPGFFRKLIRQKAFRLLLVSGEEAPLNPFFESLPERDFEVIEGLKDGCWEADIILLDIPDVRLDSVADKIREVTTQKIVLGLWGSETDAETAFSRGRLLQRLLPNSKVVTAFRPRDAAAFILEGCDQGAVQTMTGLLQDLGYEVTKAKK